MKKIMLAALLVAAPAFAFADDIDTTGGFLRASPKIANAGAGFLIITNNTDRDDRLVAAEANISTTVELHTHIKDGDIMRMRAVESIAVPAHGKAELKPGADHIMFIDLTKPLAEGEAVPVTLVFEKAGRKTITLPVVPLAAKH